MQGREAGPEPRAAARGEHGEDQPLASLVELFPARARDGVSGVQAVALILGELEAVPRRAAESPVQAQLSIRGVTHHPPP